VAGYIGMRINHICLTLRLRSASLYRCVLRNFTDAYCFHSYDPGVFFLARPGPLAVRPILSRLKRLSTSISLPLIAKD
jgi:hypothetical protein